MAIVNRTLDVTEQKKNVSFSVSVGGAGVSTPLITGMTSIVTIVPWPGTFYGAQMAALGVSGSPTYELALNRFIAGTGFTTWVLATGTSNVAHGYGTSGPGAGAGNSGMITVASSAATAILQANDVITVTTGGANSASQALSINLLIAPISDIKYNYGTGL